MEFRLKSKDVNFVCGFAATDAESRCTTSLFKKRSIIHIKNVSITRNCLQQSILCNVHLTSSPFQQHIHRYQSNTISSSVPSSNKHQFTDHLRPTLLSTSSEMTVFVFSNCTNPLINSGL